MAALTAARSCLYRLAKLNAVAKIYDHHENAKSRLHRESSPRNQPRARLTRP
jgi:hypothetical protein